MKHRRCAGLLTAAVFVCLTVSHAAAAGQGDTTDISADSTSNQPAYEEGSVQSGTAKASVQGITRYFAGLSLADPTRPEEFGKQHGAGYGGFVGLDYGLISDFELILEAGFHRFGTEAPKNSDGTLNLLTLGTNIKWTAEFIRTPVVPFIVGGAGWAVVRQDDNKDRVAMAGYDPGDPNAVWNVDTQSQFCYTYGCGLNWSIGKWSDVFVSVSSTVLIHINESLGTYGQLRFTTCSVGICWK